MQSSKKYAASQALVLKKQKTWLSLAARSKKALKKPKQKTSKASWKQLAQRSNWHKPICQGNLGLQSLAGCEFSHPASSVLIRAISMMAFFKAEFKDREALYGKCAGN